MQNYFRSTTVKNKETFQKVLNFALVTVSSVIQRKLIQNSLNVE